MMNERRPVWYCSHETSFFAKRWVSLTLLASLKHYRWHHQLSGSFLFSFDCHSGTGRKRRSHAVSGHDVCHAPSYGIFSKVRGYMHTPLRLPVVTHVSPQPPLPVWYHTTRHRIAVGCVDDIDMARIFRAWHWHRFDPSGGSRVARLRC